MARRAEALGDVAGAVVMAVGRCAPLGPYGASHLQGEGACTPNGGVVGPRADAGAPDCRASIAVARVRPGRHPPKVPRWESHVKRSTIVMLLSAAIAVAACGQSQQDKATAKVCDARADVQKQVGELRGLTLATASVDGVSQNLKAIRDDLGKIADAQSDLSDDRRQKVAGANKAFTDQVKSIAQNVGRSVSVEDSKTQLKDAMTQLSSAYKQTLGQIDCG